MFSATLVLQKYGECEARKPATLLKCVKEYAEGDVLPGKAEKFQAPAQIRTYDLPIGRRSPYHLGRRD